MKVQIIDDQYDSQEPVMMEWTIKEEPGSDLPTFDAIREAIDHILIEEWDCVSERWWPGIDIGMGIADRRK